MKLVKDVVRDHLANDIVPIINKWTLNSQNEEFKKGIIQLHLNEEETKIILDAYADKLEEIPNSKSRVFKIKGAAIGTAIKRLIKPALIADYQSFLDNVDLRVVIRKTEKEKIILYIFFRGKFYNLVDKVLFTLKRYYELIDDCKLLAEGKLTTLSVPDVDKFPKINSKLAVWNKAFIDDVVIDNTTSNPVNWRCIPRSRKLSIKNYIVNYLKIDVPENVDIITYFTVDSVNLFDNDVDTLSFTFVIKRVTK